jgi:hypothetical protein
MVAAETCLVVEGELGMEADELERPVVQVKRSRRRNLILQQATVDTAAIIDSEGFEYKAESASGGLHPHLKTLLFLLISLLCSCSVFYYIVLVEFSSVGNTI